ncbi:hypothetical protein T08_88 [Trichinella sp. T8]|nr:hypothetical protein T08_88 [Trichinella sp. T8]
MTNQRLINLDYFTAIRMGNKRHILTPIDRSCFIDAGDNFRNNAKHTVARLVVFYPEAFSKYCLSDF